MHDDAHKIIEFIGNLVASNNFALLDTFFNGTQEFFVFTFFNVTLGYQLQRSWG
jgi:hypothetical protein